MVPPPLEVWLSRDLDESAGRRLRWVGLRWVRPRRDLGKSGWSTPSNGRGEETAKI